MTKRNITQQATVNPMSDSASVNALKYQFITGMELAGMVDPSRKAGIFTSVAVAAKRFMSIMPAVTGTARPVTETRYINGSNNAPLNCCRATIFMSQ
jgi:hypothetical protein